MDSKTASPVSSWWLAPGVSAASGELIVLDADGPTATNSASTREPSARITSIDELAILESECSRVSDLLRSDELGTPVGHLGRRKVRDVGAHLGGVHRWATRMVLT